MTYSRSSVSEEGRSGGGGEGGAGQDAGAHAARVRASLLPPAPRLRLFLPPPPRRRRGKGGREERIGVEEATEGEARAGLGLTRPVHLSNCGRALKHGRVVNTYYKYKIPYGML